MGHEARWELIALISRSQRRPRRLETKCTRKTEPETRTNTLPICLRSPWSLPLSLEEAPTFSLSFEEEGKKKRKNKPVTEKNEKKKLKKEKAEAGSRDLPLFSLSLSLS